MVPDFVPNHRSSMHQQPCNPPKGHRAEFRPSWYSEMKDLNLCAARPATGLRRPIRILSSPRTRVVCAINSLLVAHSQTTGERFGSKGIKVENVLLVHHEIIDCPGGHLQGRPNKLTLWKRRTRNESKVIQGQKIRQSAGRCIRVALWAACCP